MNVIPMIIQLKVTSYYSNHVCALSYKGIHIVVIRIAIANMIYHIPFNGKH